MLPERLKECRKIHNKTQKEVAEFLGITERSYQNYEYGNREPNIATLKSLAKYFNATIDFLVSEDTEQPEQ